jgi:hypothetical protein
MPAAARCSFPSQHCVIVSPEENVCLPLRLGNQTGPPMFPPNRSPDADELLMEVSPPAHRLIQFEKLAVGWLVPLW